MLKNTLIALFLLQLTFSFGQLQAIQNQADYPFLLHLPADSVMKNKPAVLIFLHGRSLSGNNLEMVKKYGVIHEIEKGRNIPAIVIAPQVPAGKPWEADKVLSVLQFVQRTFNTDSTRVYVTGMSLGGYGTMDFAGKYPEIVAAAVALCGGGNTNDSCNLSSIPLWIQHGDRDGAVPLSESQKMVNAIRNCNGGPQLKFTVVPGANHGDLERAFRTDELYDWLFQYVKEP